MANELEIGTIIAYAGTEIPDGWQLCDGAMIDDPVSPLRGTCTPDLRSTSPFSSATPPAARGLPVPGTHTLMKIRRVLSPLEKLAKEAE